ncbi:MAG TPA: PaaI family thioesterase [Azospirillum sp.]|nr:PaaI family thioesterase [Azospirillum sp.]
MTAFKPRDPDFEARVRDSFARQTMMSTIGAQIVDLEPGACTLGMNYRRDLCQQHGYLHAGVTTTLADSAAGYAAFSLFPAGSSVLTAEFKINLLAPAAGERFLARGRVEKSGRTLTVVRSEVFAVDKDGVERPIALMLATLMCLADTADA